MINRILKPIQHIDFVMLIPAILISLAGLVTMYTWAGDSLYFERQIMWLAISLLAFLTISFVDFRFLRRRNVIIILFILTSLLLIALFVLGDTVKGATSRFSLGGFSIQPAEFAKLTIIALLAKYFTRRHIEIAHIRHILVSGVYALIVFVLILMQPDFGSAVMIFFIWLGMVLVSGISKKHLLLVFLAGAFGAGALWSFALHDYQKQRIMTFLNPLQDIYGSGYNAYQSTIAVGSGEVFGKGIGFGTQSKLRFLPEYQTDFIFASYAEEWGFVGVVLLFILFGVLIWRILLAASLGASNFEMLFGAGVAILFISHFTVHIGMNIGLLPVTGVTLPFMSYGGSHLLTEFVALGMISAMRKYSRTTYQKTSQSEFLGA